MPKTEITYEIVQQIGILKENKSGWQRELNIVKWNNGKPKLDIRDWGPNHEKVGKGISLDFEEYLWAKGYGEEQILHSCHRHSPDPQQYFRRNGTACR